MSKVVKRVTLKRWEEAQKFEFDFANNNAHIEDDWNNWWKKEFKNYKDLRGKNYENVLEVGCGPNTNLRLILPLVKAQKVYFEDPLIQQYIQLTTKQKTGLFSKVDKINALTDLFLDRKYKTEASSAMLEDLPYKDNMMDLVVCINVLDHVQDFSKCIDECIRVLKKGGTLVLGQDLSNEEDYKRSPDSWNDIGHPIKLDEDAINNKVGKFRPLFSNILSREKGRNPDAHYGTYLFIAKLT